MNENNNCLMYNANSTGRVVEIDYLKALAMLLVVWGHFLECFSSSFSHTLYQIIYMFHIPLFVFISGYLSKFKYKNLIKFVICYLVFYFIYGIFNYLLFSTPINLNFFSPYWLLWYLVSIIIWHITLPIIDKVPQKFYAFTIVVLFFIGIYLGSHGNINRFFSMSRTIAFYPFFVLGYFNKKSNTFGFNLKCKTWVKILLTILTLLLIFILVQCKLFSNDSLYMADPYNYLKHSALTRLIVYILAFAMIVLLTSLPFKKTNKLIECISKNTLTIFLLHGFVINICKKFELFKNHDISILISLLLSIALLIIFSVGAEKFKTLKNKFVKQ